jgi:hypothetical protein
MPKGRIQSVYVPANQELEISKAKRIASSKKLSFNKYILQSIKEKLERDKWQNTEKLLGETDG